MGSGRFLRYLEGHPQEVVIDLRTPVRSIRRRAERLNIPRGSSGAPLSFFELPVQRFGRQRLASLGAETAVSRRATPVCGGRGDGRRARRMTTNDY